MFKKTKHKKFCFFTIKNINKKDAFTYIIFYDIVLII